MKTTTAALALIALVALTGCASTVEPAADQQSTTVERVSETAVPLVAEEPDVEESTDESAFLEAFRDIQSTYASVIPAATDEQLLDAGYKACQRLAAGEASTDISLIEGEERNAQSEMYLDSVSIVGAAAAHLCA